MNLLSFKPDAPLSSCISSFRENKVPLGNLPSNQQIFLLNLCHLQSVIHDCNSCMIILTGNAEFKNHMYNIGLYMNMQRADWVATALFTNI